MSYILVAAVALAVGYAFGPKVVGVARSEYDAAIAALKAELDAIKAKLP